jgi:hypothetical protein
MIVIIRINTGYKMEGTREGGRGYRERERERERKRYTIN